MASTIEVREGRAWCPRTAFYESILDAAARFSDCELLQVWTATPTAKYIKYFDLASLPKEAQEAFVQAIRTAIPVWEDDEAKSEFFVDSMKAFLRLLEGETPPHVFDAYERIDVRDGEAWIPPRQEFDGIMKAVLRYADCPEIQDHLFKSWPRWRVLDLHDFSSGARQAIRNAVLTGIDVWEKEDKFDAAYVESMKAFVEMLDGNAPQHEYAVYWPSD